MLRDEILALFKEHPPAIQRIIAEVLQLEQEHITQDKPRGLKETVRKIIDRVADDEA